MTFTASDNLLEVSMTIHRVSPSLAVVLGIVPLTRASQVNKADGDNRHCIGYPLLV
jgi:hypothetical protein